MLSRLMKKRVAKGTTAVVFTGEGVAFAHIREEKGQPELLSCDFVASAKPLSEVKRFHELVISRKLENTQAVIVLPEDSYQVLLVDRPEVPDEEIAEALRWRLKDMVSFDIEQASIDYVDLPEDAYRGRNRMVYAVAAQKKAIDKYTAWCQEIGLHPAVVDIPELALLNLTEELADSEAGLAVFYIGENNSSVNLLSDMSLYFTRHLNYSRGSRPEDASGAVLELQRSLDYFESQVGKPPCVRLLVMPLQPDDSPLLNELRYSLPLDIHSLNLDSLIQSAIELPESLQQKITLGVAAALRNPLLVEESRA